MSRKRNPYINGGVIQNDFNFYGRSELIHELVIPDSNAYYIKGNRRIGKTSLLRQIERNLILDSTVVPVYFNLQGTKNLKDLLLFYQRAINKACHNNQIKNFNLGNSFFQTFNESLEHIGALGKQFYLLIDEAESLLHLPENIILKFHHELVNTYDHLTVVVSATNHLENLELQRLKGLDLLEGFTPIQLSCFSKEDAKNLIRQVQHPEGGIDIDDDLEHAILKYTGTHPYLIQRMCFNLFDRRTRTLRQIKKNDFTLDQSIRNFCNIDFNFLNIEQQQILQRFSWETPMNNIEIEGFSLPTITSSLIELEQSGFLACENNQYKLSNYYLAQWLEERQSKALKPQKRTTSISKLNLAKSIRALNDDLFEKKLPTKKTPTLKSNNASSNSTQTGKLSPVQIKVICDYIDSNMEAAFEAMDKLDWGNQKGTYNDKKEEWVSPGIGFNRVRFRSQLKLLLKMVFE